MEDRITRSTAEYEHRIHGRPFAIRHPHGNHAPVAIERAIAGYAASGVKGVTVWREALAGRDAGEIGNRIRDRGMTVASLCRGGFFAADSEATRRSALDENRRCIDQAAALGAPMVVLVCGASPGQELEESRRQIEDALFALVPTQRLPA